MFMGSRPSTSLHLACCNSLLISGVIVKCDWCFNSSSRASFCSELISPLYRCTNVRKAWCQRTGSSRVSWRNLKIQVSVMVNIRACRLWSTMEIFPRCIMPQFQMQSRQRPSSSALTLKMSPIVRDEISMTDHITSL